MKKHWVVTVDSLEHTGDIILFCTEEVARAKFMDAAKLGHAALYPADVHDDGRIIVLVGTKALAWV